MTIGAKDVAWSVGLGIASAVAAWQIGGPLAPRFITRRPVMARIGFSTAVLAPTIFGDPSPTGGETDRW